MANHPIHDIKTPADYISAAKALPQDHLNNAFIPRNDFKDFTRKQETMAQIKATSVELGTHSGSTEGVITNGVGLKRQNEQEEQAKGGRKGKKGNDTINLMTLLDQLGNDIAAMEAGFEDRHGDAWREKLAEIILDPDEIPQREDGESMEDYRERVEYELVNKMIDPETGTVKDEYLNSDDPDVREAAEWAQKKYDEDKVAELKRSLDDPNLTDEEKRELIEEYNQSSTGSRMPLSDHMNPEQISEYGVSSEDDNNLTEVASSRTGPENTF